MQVINPATEELICSITGDNKEILAAKYNRLKEAQPSWAASGLKKRIEILKSFSGLMAERIEDLSQVLTSEIGKPLQQSRNEINGAITRTKWLSENAGKYLCEEIMSETAQMTEKINYEPLGVCL